ncbi:unnamed protein product [Amoebophrya sp. A25]|nr:unnamed protein product [Amoebophrya sp. A25]|eukprot:GSA25T00006697001.1
MTPQGDGVTASCSRSFRRTTARGNIRSPRGTRRTKRSKNENNHEGANEVALVVTGGGCGGIRVWELFDHTIRKKPRLLLDSPDAHRGQVTAVDVACCRNASTDYVGHRGSRCRNHEEDLDLLLLSGGVDSVVQLFRSTVTPSCSSASSACIHQIEGMPVNASTSGPRLPVRGVTLDQNLANHRAASVDAKFLRIWDLHRMRQGTSFASPRPVFHAKPVFEGLQAMEPVSDSSVIVASQDVDVSFSSHSASSCAASITSSRAAVEEDKEKEQPKNSFWVASAEDTTDTIIKKYRRKRMRTEQLHSQVIPTSTTSSASSPLVLTGGSEFVALFDVRNGRNAAQTIPLAGHVVINVAFNGPHYLLAQTRTDRQFLFDRRKL